MFEKTVKSCNKDVTKWDRVAKQRFIQIESGRDITFSKVFVPLYTELLRAAAPKTLLEIGCGTGHLAKLLIELGFEVTAIEPAPSMFSIAIEMLKNLNCSVFNSKIEEFSSGLQYDICLSHLCLNSVKDVPAFFKSVASNINHFGQFIFSVPHPCFWNEIERWISPEKFDYTKEIYSEDNAMKLTLDNEEIRGIPYFHRPLSFYCTELKNAGFSVTDFLEVMPPIELAPQYGTKWKNPRFCVFLTRKGQLDIGSQK